MVPVRQLEEFVRGRAAFYDSHYLSDDPTFTHAHVTVLGPFVERLTDDVASRIAAIVAEEEPFDFALDRMGTFPNGIIHLVPDPEDRLRELTGRFRAEIPDFRPYAGACPTRRRTSPSMRSGRG